jgi:hypothetical protein
MTGPGGPRSRQRRARQCTQLWERPGADDPTCDAVAGPEGVQFVDLGIFTRRGGRICALRRPDKCSADEVLRDALAPITRQDGGH